MEEREKIKNYALLGRNISYSFSATYFADKFEKENIHNAKYFNLDLQNIEDFLKEIQKIPNLCGLNVTIPYKETILQFLDEIDPIAAKIGAVNTIKILDNYKLKGFNTDYFGFKNSLQPLLSPNHRHALILGTGGASKAVAFALQDLEISYTFVSREKRDNCFIYSDLNQDILQQNTVIINCTPLGTFPNIDVAPPIPYEFLTSEHLLYDLVYNPPKTKFLQQAQNQGATIINGYQMLVLQAEKSWEIWRKSH